jgi:hypothetical protein
MARLGRDAVSVRASMTFAYDHFMRGCPFTSTLMPQNSVEVIEDELEVRDGRRSRHRRILFSCDSGSVPATRRLDGYDRPTIQAASF